MQNNVVETLVVPPEWHGRLHQTFTTSPTVAICRD
jgi:NADH:ubiquinone oxidoreductase subunit